eukprot:14287663-Alexandrium_andersonii.AAC.1
MRPCPKPTPSPPSRLTTSHASEAPPYFSQAKDLCMGPASSPSSCGLMDFFKKNLRWACRTS